ncbi:MAG: tetratricopeptide repeat protein [Treponema sp.]|jgi:cytochrome c-type biogenesis protein CcmH/NrfG|nr:tetratricopeptide repeat protein [Treponema sp.]
MQQATKNRIVFIQVPDFLLHPSHHERTKGAEEMSGTVDMGHIHRVIDPSIPLPVELPPGVETLTNADISEEMILSGMLRLLAAEPAHQNVAYYRYLILSIRPNILNELTYAAMMKAENEDFDMAIEILDTLKGLFPYSSELLARKKAVLQKEKTASRQNTTPKAAAFNADTLFTRAYSDINRDNIDEGLANIRAFLGKNPHIWNAWFLLGWGLRKQFRYEDAEAAFRTAIEKGGANADTRNELAICLMEKGDLKAARKELETALHTEPENVKVISNLGVLALKMGNKIEAAGFFRTVLELDSSDVIAQDILNDIERTASQEEM